MISSKTKIGLLVAGHVVAGLLLGWACHDRGPGTSPKAISLYSLAFTQAGLLGIWGGLGTTRAMWRIPAVFITAAYVCAELLTVENAWDYSPMSHLRLVASPTVGILVLLSGLRHGRRRLCVVQSLVSSPTGTGLQYTSRHLLLATAVVAVVLATGRGLRPLFDGGWIYHQVLFTAILILVLILVELATLWAALGIGRPTPKLAVVVPSAFVVEAILAYYQEDILPTDWGGLSDFIFWPAVVGLQAIITAGSLLVVRSCGWRLVRGAATDGKAAREEIEPLPTPPGS